MRLFCPQFDITMNEVVLYLTKEEMKELADGLYNLLSLGDLSSHIHVNDLSYRHEITATVYSENNMTMLNDRSKIIIKDDK